MAFTLNQTSKKYLEQVSGLSWNQVIEMDVEDLDKAIEKKIGKQLTFFKRDDSRLPGRGSVYLTLKRFLSFNHRKMNKIIDSISIE